VITLVDAARSRSLMTYEGWEALDEEGEAVRPPLLNLSELKALSPSALCEYNEARRQGHGTLGPYGTPEGKTLLEDLDLVVQSNAERGDQVRSSVVLDAPAGLGKTTLVRRYARRLWREQIALHGQLTAEGNTRVPIAYVCLSGKTTVRNFNSSLCNFYAHPAGERGNAADLGRRAAYFARATETRIIVVDEVHYLNPNSVDGHELANQFKSMTNDSLATFIYVGVGVAKRGLLTEGLGSRDSELAQIARRWICFTMTPFSLLDDEHRLVWLQLLGAIDNDLILANKYPHMVAKDLAAYLFERSGGHFGSLMSLIRQGCYRAIRSGEERLTIDLLDTITNDVASEAGRLKLGASIRHGLMTTFPAS
jgi:hypothetical protein